MSRAFSRPKIVLIKDEVTYGRQERPCARAEGGPRSGTDPGTGSKTCVNADHEAIASGFADVVDGPGDYLSEQVMENPLIDLDAFQERSETTWRVRDEDDDPFARAIEPFTFHDYLKEQIPFFDLEKNVETLCRYMIDCLDARGYLPKPIVERCLEDPRIEPIARKAIGTLRAMDPVGVGACGLEECLVLQLKAMGHDYDLTYEIVNGHLDELARNQLGSIARACNVRRGDVDASVRVIRRLSPIPSRGFNVLNDAVRVKPEATLIPDERGGVEVVLASSWSEAIRIDERLASRLDEGATQGTCGKWLEGAKSLKECAAST